MRESLSDTILAEIEGGRGWWWKAFARLQQLLEKAESSRGKKKKKGNTCLKPISQDTANA